jgi:predicted DNA-binding protein
MERISIRVHAWQREALDELAAAAGTTASCVVRALIEDATDHARLVCVPLVPEVEP